MMKNFLSTKWKKILYVICGIAIVIDLFFILITPNNVMDDYYKYGPEYEQSIINVDADGNELIEKTAEKTGTSFGTAKIIIIVVILIVACLILDDYMQGKDKKK